MILSVLLVALLAVLSVMLTTVEGAFSLVKRRHLRHLALQNDRADLANLYLEDPPRLLMPLAIGTYTAHVGMTVIITSLLLERLAHWALLVALGVMLVYLLVFRLTIPYALVRRNPERVLLLALPAFDAYARALGPLVRWLRRRAEPQPLPAGAEEAPAVPEVPPPPVHDPDEGRMLDAVSRFAATQVKDVMTPRPDIVAVSVGVSVGDLRRVLRETRYSRLPVYGENLDDVVGVVGIREVVEFEGQPAEPALPLAREPFLVPETKRIADLLKEFQQRRTTLAVVVDEYGGTAGLVTVEDIVEEIVGEIKDEYDVEAEPIAVDEEGWVQVAGRVNVDRLEQALETSLVDGEDVDTVGGLVAAVFGRIPRAGEKAEFRGFDLEVVDAERKRVNRVRFRRKAVVEEEE